MSNKTQELKFTGSVRWAKVFEDNRDMFEWNDETGAFDKPSTTGGRYSIEVTLSDTDYRELKKSGSVAAKFSKYDDDGNDVVRFKREHEKRGKGGALLEFASGAPKVVKADGSKWDFEEDGDIYNGSVCEVTIQVYKTAYSPGTRLEQVKVIEAAKAPDKYSEEGGEEVPF